MNTKKIFLSLCLLFSAFSGVSRLKANLNNPSDLLIVNCVSLPRVIGSFPTPNSTSIPLNAGIFIALDTAVLQSTVNDSTILVQGEFTGRIFGTIQLSPTGTQVSIDPSRDFFPGEKITVTLTTGIETVGGCNLEQAYSFEFHALVPTGLGHFRELPRPNATTQNFRVTQVADLDLDGDLDGVAVQNPSGLWIWENDGEGTFTASNLGSTTFGINKMYISDFNRDYFPDLVTYNKQGGKIEVWLNDGTGGIGASSTVYTTSLGTTVKPADFDGNGWVDLLVCEGNNLSVFTNSGTGTFTQGTVWNSGSPIFENALGDIDLDGDIDVLIVANGANKIWLNNGQGSLAYSQNLGVGFTIGASLGDLNSDGYLDVYLLNITDDEVWLGASGGAFLGPQAINSTGSDQIQEVGIYDLDGDDDLDILRYGHLTQWKWQVLQNDGNATFSNGPIFNDGARGKDIGIGDMDGDGDLDLFSPYAGRRILYNHCPDSVPTPAAIADFQYCIGGSIPTMSVSVPDSMYNVVWYDSQVGNDTAKGLSSGVNGEFFQPTYSGSDTFYVEMIKDSSLQCSSPERRAVFLVEDTLPLVFLAQIPLAVCRNASPVPLNGIPIGGFYFGGGVTDSSFAPETADSGGNTVGYVFTDSFSGCTDSAFQVIQVLDTLHPIIQNLAPTYCPNEPATMLFGVLPGSIGSFSGPGITDSVGVFNPGIASIGENLISLTLTDSVTGCVSKGTDEAVVIPTITPSILNLPTHIVLGSPTIPLQASPSGGVFASSGNAIIQNNILYPTPPVVAGQSTIIYDYVDNESGCTSATNQVIQILDSLSPPSILGLAPGYCESGPPVLLAGFPADTNGSFSGAGIQDSWFSPGAAGPGIHAVTWRFNGTDSISQMVFVDSILVPQLIGLDSVYCFGSDTVVVTSNPTGSLTGPGMSQNVLFDPVAAGPGLHTIEYFYVSPGGCVVESDEQVIVKPPLGAFITGLGMTYASSSDTVSLQSSSLVSGSPVFTGNGIIGESFVPIDAGPGEHLIHLSFTDLNGCTAEDTQTVTVTIPGESAITGLPPVLCLYDDPIGLQSNPPSSSFFVDGVGKSVFNPSLEGAGWHEVRVEFANSFSVDSVYVDSFTVELVGLEQRYCANDSIAILSGTPSTNGVFFGNGITFNLFDPSANTLSGTDTVSYAGTSSLGCNDTTFKVVSIDTVPTFSFQGPLEYCATEIAVQLNVPPNSGAFSGNWVSPLGEFSPNLAGHGTHFVEYSDSNSFGCRSIVGAELTVVGDTIGVVFSGLGERYCATDTLDQLSGFPGGGWFNQSGTLWLDSLGEFNPSAVATLGNLLEVSYSYSIPLGSGQCVFSYSDTTIVHSLPQVGIMGLQSDYCVQEDTALLQGTPFGGTFEGNGLLLDSFFLPSLADSGNHIISYTFLDTSTGCTGRVFDTVTVHPVPQISFTGLEPRYCSNQSGDSLIGNNFFGVFYLDSVDANNSIPEFFDPQSSGLGNFEVIYQIEPLTGCTTQYRQAVNVIPPPVADFGLLHECRDSLAFVSLSQEEPDDSILYYNWNFGNGNTSTASNPIHVYPADSSNQGNSVWLEVVTDLGCSDTIEKDVYPGQIPVVGFDFYNTCESEITEFREEVDFSFWPQDSITLTWNFGNGTFATGDSTTYSFIGRGVYTVVLEAETNKGCLGSDTQWVAIRPVVDQFPFLDDFQSDVNLWGTARDNSSWEWMPFDSAVGLGGSLLNNDSIWVTQASGQYENLEQSYLLGPCFDLTEMNRPMVEFDLNFQTEEGFDGGVLQYSKDGGQNWERVGEIDDPWNWYNVDNINGLANLGDHGWSGNSSGWVPSKHDLKELERESKVEFRFAFGANEQVVNAGIAVNNFAVREKDKFLLLEKFTHTSDLNTLLADAYLDTLTSQNQEDMAGVFYHLNLQSQPTPDPLAVSSSNGRYVYYDISLNTTVLDGNDYSGAPYLVDQYWIDSLSLEAARFDIDLDSLEVSGSNILTRAAVEWRPAGNFPQGTKLFIAVVERSLPDGQKWVLKAMDPLGTSLDSLFIGQPMVFLDTFQVSNVSNWDSLGVVAFVQNPTTKEVFQAAYCGPLVDVTPTPAHEAESAEEPLLWIYPNPTSEGFHVETPFGKLDQVELINSIGQVVLTTKTSRAKSFIQTSRLPDGVYYFRAKVKGRFVSKRVLVVKQ